MRTMTLSAAELLELEERQLHYFLTAVRPVGEEKSELYPEPQYFQVGFISVAALMPDVLRRIAERTGGAEAYARRCKRVLSPATALHIGGLGFIATWGREMWLLDEPGTPDTKRGIITTADAPTVSDADSATILRFADTMNRIYRNDGEPHPNPAGALGKDWCIMAQPDVDAVASQTVPVDAEQAREVLGLLAAVRALSFLMEAETREATFMQGPYRLADGNQLVIFECSDLRWDLFPNFELPDGARWELPEEPVPYANLAIAMVLKDVNVSADRFGTLYVDPLGPEQLVAAGLFTRGTDPWTDEGLRGIPVTEARALRRRCDEVQEFFFLQAAMWDLPQRMMAGVCQEHMLLLRMLSAAGFTRDEIIAEQQAIFRLSQPIIDRYFQSTLERPVEKLPFYVNIGAFAGGTAPTLFTRFAESMEDQTA